MVVFVVACFSHFGLLYGGVYIDRFEMMLARRAPSLALVSWF